MKKTFISVAADAAAGCRRSTRKNSPHVLGVLVALGAIFTRAALGELLGDVRARTLVIYKKNNQGEAGVSGAAMQAGQEADPGSTSNFLSFTYSDTLEESMR